MPLLLLSSRQQTPRTRAPPVLPQPRAVLITSPSQTISVHLLDRAGRPPPCRAQGNTLRWSAPGTRPTLRSWQAASAATTRRCVRRVGRIRIFRFFYTVHALNDWSFQQEMRRFWLSHTRIWPTRIGLPRPSSTYNMHEFVFSAVVWARCAAMQSNAWQGGTKV